MRNLIRRTIAIAGVSLVATLGLCLVGMGACSDQSPNR